MGIAIALVGCIRMAFADNVLSRISVRNAHREDRFYGEVHRFPASVRDYSDATLFGYSFREELPGGGVRELQVSRFRSPGAYLIATDLFANGRFSTMSHTVMMVFPRRTGGGRYRVAPQASGDVHVLAPDGSMLVVDGSSGGVRPSRDFDLAPMGAPGTPPALRHRGFHFTIQSVGRSPFLRGTPVEVRTADGDTCRLSAEDVFLYGDGPESDLFRFVSDEEFFAYVGGRCPSLVGGPAVRQASFAKPQMPLADASAEPVPILVPASATAARAPAPTYGRKAWPSRTGGLLWQLFSQ